MDPIKQLFLTHQRIFITGTDTEVGKTYCSSLIVQHLNQADLDVFPFKPIAAGTEHSQEFNQEVNEDAVALYDACKRKYSLSQINPITYAPPIAPHIAAELEGFKLDFALLDQELKKVKTLGQSQLIEGAGGWLLPLNEHQLLSDWVAKHQLPVILVVSIKLGCLNHALLTAQAIKASGCDLVGWIANFNHGETDIGRKNMEYIQSQLDSPLLFEVHKDQRAII
jgi:dethiobiotin synthetase